MNKKERYDKILGHFREKMPVVTTELDFGSTFQLLVAVVLSAQCTDKRINQVTPDLFAHYPDAKSMAKAEEEEVFEWIKSVSYPNAKAKHLVEMARVLMEKFDGEVPSTLDELLTLPGVGRKTANVIQSVAFGKATLAVDTHVFRVAHRLGLVSKSDNTPYKVEMALTKYIPEEEMRVSEFLRKEDIERKNFNAICVDLRDVHPVPSYGKHDDGTDPQQ